MADKTKTIKNATDEELNALYFRLMKERDVQRIVGDLRRNAQTPQQRQLEGYDYPISTEESIESLYHDAEDFVHSLVSNMGDMSPEEVLEHHGILGMKWGVRKYQNKDGTLTEKGKKQKAKQAKKADKKKAKEVKKRGSDDHATAKALKKKKIKELSNDELNTLLKRQELERRYADLNPSTQKYGQKVVTDILKESGKELAKEAVKTGVKKGAKKAVGM